MDRLSSAPSLPRLALLDEISEREEHGFIILSPRYHKPFRRILYLNSYGGTAAWEKVKHGRTPSQHLWGCVQLASIGYEVALAEPIHHFNYRRPLPHDLPLLKWAKSWLQKNDIFYCAHTLLFWLPMLKAIGFLRCHIVSLTYAREVLDFAGVHSAIIALTPAAAHQAKIMAPKTKVAHLGWGSDPDIFPHFPYRPDWFLSCGLTHRDHYTLSAAARGTKAKLRVITPYCPPHLNWSTNVLLLSGGRHDDTISHYELLMENYSRCAASLIILKNDPEHKTAVGFTNLLEAMSMARPVIVTRTGALETEIDVEKQGIGVYVAPGDHAMLKNAIDDLAANPVLAEQMGARGRSLAERHYNMARFSKDLHQLFESL